MCRARLGTLRLFVEQFNRTRAYLAGPRLGPFLIRSLAGSAGVQAGGLVLTFLVGVQLARGLGVKSYGYYGMAMSVIAIATVLSGLGLPKLITREVAAVQARNDHGLLFHVLRWADRTCWRISAAVAVATVITAAILWRADSKVLAAAILFGAPMIALNSLASIRAGALRGLQHIVKAGIPNTIVRPLVMSVALFAIFLAGSRLQPATAMALNSVTALASLLLINHWLGKILPKERPPAASSEGGWLASSIPMAVSDMIGTLQRQASVLVLGILTIPLQVGLFRVSTSTAAVLAVPITLVNVVFMPVVSKLHTERDRGRLKKLVTSTARTQLLGVFLLALPLLFAAAPLLGLVFGSRYEAAANATRILAAGMIISSVCGPNVALLNMTGHERRVTRAVLIALLVNLSLLVLGGAEWGSAGAAAAFAIGQLSCNILLLMDARRRLSLDTSVFGIHPPLDRASTSADAVRQRHHPS